MKTIEKLEQMIKEAQQGIEEIKKKEEQIDFTKFIGRYGYSLAIKGEKLLKIHDDGTIEYSNMYRNDYNKPITYKESMLSKLEKGDIFILKENINNPDVMDFNIFIGKTFDGKYLSNYLMGNLDNLGLEYIDNTLYDWGDEEILIFNKDEKCE